MRPENSGRKNPNDPKNKEEGKAGEPIKEKSKLKELEDRLRDEITKNPDKPLDYKLLNQIQEEVSTEIVNWYRLQKLFKGGLDRRKLRRKRMTK